MNKEIKTALIKITQRFLECDEKEAQKQADRWLAIVKEIMEEEEC